MLKELLKVANHLDSLGLTKEADALDSIIYKIAGPLVPGGIFALDPNEPIVYPANMKPLEEQPVRIDPLREVKRRKSILRDKRERERLKREQSWSKASPEEKEQEETNLWYKSIQNFRDNIIVIPFDKDEVDKNPILLNAMGDIFGITNPRNYAEFHLKASMETATYSSRSGSLEKLKTNFPVLWSDIQGALSANGLEENEAIYMFYNQDTSPIRPLFTKNPDFFGHDFGHNIFDSQNPDSHFKDLLKDFIQNLLKLYVTADKKSISDRFLDRIYNDSGSGKYLSNVFGNPSGQEDVYGDIFGLATGGRLSFREDSIPESFWIQGDEYSLPPENVQEARELLKNCMEDLNNYVNPNHSSDGFEPGPLADFAGSVVLNDI
jgi:hypothetical protein